MNKLIAQPFEVTIVDIDDPEFNEHFEHQETRYRLIDSVTGKVVNDANGYGFKTAQNAHRATGYHKGKHRGGKTRKQKVETFLKQHPELRHQLLDAMFETVKTGDRLTEVDFDQFITDSGPNWLA